MKKTKEKIKQIVNKFGYKFLNSYRNKRSIIKVVIQDSFGYKYNVCLNSVLKESKIRKIAKSNPFCLKNISLWLKLNNKNFKLTNKNKYENEHSKLSFYCLKCKKIFYSTWGCISQGNGCPMCSGNIVTDKNRLSILYPEIIKEWHSTKNNNLTANDVSYSSGKRVWWLCHKCNYEWETVVSSRTIGGTSCPRCKESKGEKRISKFLEKNNIFYIHQYRFKDCKDKHPLPFDFYLPYSNKIIEYNGRQHYNTFRNDYFGGEKALQERIKKDKIKKNYCRKNKINFLIIPYLKFNDIEKILEKYLFT